MATAPKKSPVKKKAAAKKPATAAKKAPAKTSRAKAPQTSRFFSNVVKDAWGQLDQWVDTAKLKAKELAAEEQLMQKKAELAIKAEVDHAKHMADQAEKWMRARMKSDAKRLNAYEKKLKKQLRDAEKKLKAQAKAAERKANKKSKALKKQVEGVTRKLAVKTGITAPTKRTATRKAAPKKTAPKKVAAKKAAPKKAVRQKKAAPAAKQ